MSLLHKSTVIGACVIATATMFIAPVCAAPADYGFELAAVGPDQGIVTIRLKNNLKGQLVPNALIDCAAYVGPNGVTTMTEVMVANPGPKPGEYILIAEPGMSVFDVDLFAQVPGEAQLVTGKSHVNNQNAQGQNNNNQ
jgi:hypothetical protein